MLSGLGPWNLCPVQSELELNITGGFAFGSDILGSNPSSGNLGRLLHFSEPP